MPRGGARPGAGKKKGSFDRATLERELAAAQQQLVELTKKRETGRKMAVDVLDDIMHLSMGLAAKHQPLEANEIAGPGRDPNDEKFHRYLELTVDTASKLANFQSPKFKSVTLSVETPPGGAVPAGGVVGAITRMSAQEAYRMLRDSSELIDLQPEAPAEQPEKKAKKA